MPSEMSPVHCFVNTVGKQRQSRLLNPRSLETIILSRGKQFCAFTEQQRQTAENTLNSILGLWNVILQPSRGTDAASVLIILMSSICSWVIQLLLNGSNVFQNRPGIPVSLNQPSIFPASQRLSFKRSPRQQVVNLSWIFHCWCIITSKPG